MLKHAGTYEIMTPESVGRSKSSFTMGKLSGRHALREKLKQVMMSYAFLRQGGIQRRDPESKAKCNVDYFLLTNIRLHH